ncbi:hypothetical protein [Methanosarcina sp.]|uniref:hypothetical protein n=1 Tax=Methanosarcina sp. TaxID=2213 RepID=UPI002ABA8B0D|nr:hypothetical protein [Methanosarcina sp.]MDY9925965.1 hypothetical protein [Methanosarcina sp.]
MVILKQLNFPKIICYKSQAAGEEQVNPIQQWNSKNSILDISCLYRGLREQGFKVDISIEKNLAKKNVVKKNIVKKNVAKKNVARLRRSGKLLTCPETARQDSRNNML